MTLAINTTNFTPKGITLSNSIRAENSGSNSVIGNFTTTDTSGDTFTYSLVSGPGSTDNAEFNILGNQLRATNSLDFEAGATRSIRVRSTDQGGLFFERSFNITVTNVNEAPTAIILDQTALMENGGVNAVVGNVSTIDPDATNAFTYSFVPGPGDTDNSQFQIVDNELQAATSLDFEAGATRSVRVRTTDQDGLWFEQTFTIAVTNVNESPTALALTHSSLTENAGANAAVGSFATADPDAANTFSYSLVAGPGDTDNLQFQIVDNELQAANSLDFEAGATRSVRVRTTDQGGLWFEQTFTIAVTNVNESPTALALTHSSLAENAGANAAVGSFATTDPDAANTFSYTLVVGPGDTDNSQFQIVDNELQAATSLDFEAGATRSVRVRTTDQGGLWFEQTFTIAVTNVNESPTALALTHTSLAENASANAAVGSFASTDPDAANTFWYSLAVGPGDTDNSQFQIVGDALQAVASLDFEAGATRSVRVRTTDQGGLWFEQIFTIAVINVNETPTNLTLSQTTIPENAAVGTVVGTFLATDPDVGDSFTYSIMTGSISSFSIVGNRLQLAFVPDYETQSAYAITVRATDAGGLWREASFSISVTDVIEGGVPIQGTEGDDTLTVIYSPSDITVSRSTSGGPASLLGNYPIGTELIVNGLGGVDQLVLELTPDQLGDFTTTQLLAIKSFLAASAGATLDTTIAPASDLSAVNVESARLLVSDDGELIDITAIMGSILDESQIVVGTPGDDSLKGTAAIDLILGQGGNDALEGLDGADWLFGGAGNDSLLGGSGSDLLAGGSGDDALWGDTGFDDLRGGAGADMLDGGLHDDVLNGGPGIDSLHGGDGYDQLSVMGDEAEFDLLDGGANTDLVVNVGGTPVVISGFLSGANAIEGWNGGGQPILGNSTANTLHFLSVSLSGVPYIDGGAGDDSITGTNGVDSLRGGEGKDTLWGMGGVDYLYGDAGADSLHGGDGTDHLYGGEGADTITSGAGRDTIYFAGDVGSLDTITDFALYSDAISLQAYTLMYSQLSFSISSGATMITLPNGKQIRLLNWSRVVTSSQFRL
ncbi:MAG: cadherin domain-containing protein [Pirellulales bacterium]